MPLLHRRVRRQTVNVKLRGNNPMLIQQQRQATTMNARRSRVTQLIVVSNALLIPTLM